MINKLNVGCGKDIRTGKGWVNVDKNKNFDHKNMHNNCFNFDLMDLYKSKKMPFNNNSFGLVFCSHVLEDFADIIPLFDELIRVCSIGGKIVIEVPNETQGWSNPYHKRAFNINTFVELLNKKNYEKERYCLKIKSLRFVTIKDISSLIRPLYSVGPLILNCFPRWFVNATLLKFCFPMVNIRVEYEKVKK